MSSSTHLLRISDSWSIWRTFALRGAGFPAEIPLRLATPTTARLADAWNAQKSVVEKTRAHAIAALRHALSDEERKDDPVLLKTIKAVQKSKAPNPAPGLPAAVDQFVAELARQTQLNEELAATAAVEQANVSGELRKVASDERFREAITWQNLSLLPGALDLYLASAHGTNSKTRQREWLIASYIQRYCLKNESIGFFGPIGWGCLVPDRPTITFSPGSTITHPLSIYFEAWGIEALGHALAMLPGVKEWIPPRRSPLIRVAGTTVHSPFGSFELPSLQGNVLAACDGLRPAREIAAALHAEASETQVYDTLATLQKQDLIRWAFEIPALPEPHERVLREQLERIGDPDVRQRTIPQLDELCHAHCAIKEAKNAEEVAGALAALDATFERLTGYSATRNAGQTYAGRTLIQCQARRNADLVLNPDVLERIALPLALLAQAARWWSHVVARAYTGEIEATFRQLCTMRGTASIDFIHLWPIVSRLFPRAGGGEIPASVIALINDYKWRWAGILAGAQGSANRLTLSAADIKDAVEAAFAAPAPGWPAARVHSPDLMIAADSPEAIARGEYQWVMGETHFFLNSIEQGRFFREYPAQEELQRWLTQDHPRGRVTPAAFGSRANSALSNHPRDVEVEHDWTPSWRPRAQVLAISEMVVREIDGQLYVATRDDQRRFSLGAAINSLFANLRGLPLSIVPDDPHTPRVTIDGLVVVRESWRFRTSELTFATETKPLERFAAARAWASMQGIPRFSFYKCSSEVKPYYVDFDSMIYVEMLAKAVRAAETITLTEMLPTPDQCWLLDRDGNRYTCELRTVLVDDADYPAQPAER